MLSFTGVQFGETFEEQPSTPRRDRHLAFTVSPIGHVYLLLRPDVLLADLVWSARLAAIFSQYLAPVYLERPRNRRARKINAPAAGQPTYAFSSVDLIESLHAGGHEQYDWPGPSEH